MGRLLELDDRQLGSLFLAHELGTGARDYWGECVMRDSHPIG